MAGKELKRLSRADLLELLLRERRENEQLRAEIESLEKQLADRSIAIQNAGSVAEASLRLSGIFSAAQKAADQYLENVRRLNARQKSLCEQMKAKTDESRLITGTSENGQSKEAAKAGESDCQSMASGDTDGAVQPQDERHTPPSDLPHASPGGNAHDA